jgi:hypothetical protein
LQHLPVFQEWLHEGAILLGATATNALAIKIECKCGIAQSCQTVGFTVFIVATPTPGMRNEDTGARAGKVVVPYKSTLQYGVLIPVVD